MPCTDEAFAAALESAPADSGIDPKDLKVSSAKCVEGWAYVDLIAPDAEFQALFEYANDPTDPGGTWVFLTSDEPLPVSEMVQHGVPRDVAEQLCPGC